MVNNKLTLSLVAASVLALSACGSTSEPTAAAPQVSQQDPATIDLYIPHQGSYTASASVPQHLVDECPEVFDKLANAVRTFGAEQGVNVAHTDKTYAEVDNYVALNVVSMFSAGNAFIGHAKSTTVEAVYYKNGKQVDKKMFSRNSNGGFFGGFKSSCSVIGRTVHTIGSDIVKWLDASHI